VTPSPSDFNLRHAVGRRHGPDHGAQRQQQVADVARQHVAFTHVGNIAALALVKAHQHPALLRHHAHRQAGAVAVAPGRPLQRRQNQRRTQLADVPEGVFQRALLDGHLRARLQVLHGTAPTDAKVRAARHDALRRRAQHFIHARNLVRRLAAHRDGGDPFARQGAFHEYHFPVAAGDPPGFQIQGLDTQNV
jgi:hypothetical protein